MRAFQQVDVFTNGPFTGNPVAVVLDGEGLSDAEMQRIATWTNLSETTFVLPSEVADYRVRIFTGSEELPFAGHPTLGTCHAVGLEGDRFVQECAAGLIRIEKKGSDPFFSFAAPPRVRSEPLDDARVREWLGVEPVAMRWCDNGPGWMGVLLEDADQVRALKPPPSWKIGVAAPEDDWIVRCFFDGEEDPVTGSFNAALAQWLVEEGRATLPYVAHQTTGRVHVSGDADAIWVGGATVTRIDGAIITA